MECKFFTILIVKIAARAGNTTTGIPCSFATKYYFTTCTHCPFVLARKVLSYMASHCKPGK